MKVKGSYAPQPFEYEILGRTARLSFFESVEAVNEIGDDENSAFVGWQFDRYTIERPYDAGLLERVEGNLAAWLAAAKADERDGLAAKIRARRNKALQDTDITQLIDSPIGEAERAAYRNYRQALRDLPEQAGFPYSVEFPELELQTETPWQEDISW